MRLPFCNTTRFAGYVGNEIERRYIGTDAVPTVSVRIVAKLSYKEAGVWKTHDEWATVVFWRKLADELVEAGIGKGDFIHVEGRRNTRQYKTEASRGKPATAHEIIAESWHQVQLGKIAKDSAVSTGADLEDPQEKPSPRSRLNLRDLA